MAYIVAIAHLPVVKRLGAGIIGDQGGHGGGGGVVIGKDDWGSLPPNGIDMDGAIYHASPGWVPIKTGGEPDLGAYSRDPAKNALAQAWRTLRYAANSQNSYQPPPAFKLSVAIEAVKKPISGGGTKDIGFRKISNTKERISEDLS